MKKIKFTYMFLFLFFSIFFFGIDDVRANELNWEDVKIECIYNDGGSYTTNIGVSEAVVNRINYNLEGSSQQENPTTGAMIFVNSTKMYNSQHHCQPYVISGRVHERSDDEDLTTYYKFFGNDVDQEDMEFVNNDFEEYSWWSIAFSDETARSTRREEANDTKKTYELVSEQYILDGFEGEPNYILTYRQENSQAAGTDNYAHLLFYDDDVILLKTDKRVTILDGDTSHFDDISVNDNGEVTGLEDNDVIYLNDPEVKTMSDSNYITSYYYTDGQYRYNVSLTKTTDNSRKFTLFNTGLGDGDPSDDDLCDAIMPETAKVLRDIIKYAQILVPVFLIILMAIDIGKIVISGNLDEELPKQKKKLMTRLVIAIIFFFLPLITMLLLDTIKDSGLADAKQIRSIQCLFSDD